MSTLKSIQERTKLHMLNRDSTLVEGIGRIYIKIKP
jgi:hypothetical protein